MFEANSCARICQTLLLTVPNIPSRECLTNIRNRICHLDTAGRLSVIAEDPEGTLLAAPTNVCLAGPGLDRLVAANLNRWHLTLLDLGLVGAPVHRPARWAVDVLPRTDPAPGA